MAIIAIPGLISLVSHSCGGAILSTAANGYVAGSLIPASVIAAAPVALGTVMVVGAGAYFYLHGIPAPIAEILAAKGLGTTLVAPSASVPIHTASAVASSHATGATVFAVSSAQIVAVLAALAVVSYIAYTHSDAVKNTIDTAAQKAKASTLETVAEIREALEKVSIAAGEYTNNSVNGAKIKINDVVQTVDQVTDKVNSVLQVLKNLMPDRFKYIANRLQ